MKHREIPKNLPILKCSSRNTTYLWKHWSGASPTHLSNRYISNTRCKQWLAISTRLWQGRELINNMPNTSMSCNLMKFIYKTEGNPYITRRSKQNELSSETWETTSTTKVQVHFLPPIIPLQILKLIEDTPIHYMVRDSSPKECRITLIST